MLPTGTTHIAVRVGGEPLRIFDDAADRRGHRLGHAVAGGARTFYHLRDISQPSVSVGAVLCPGAAAVLLGAPESALAGHHTPLEFLLAAGEVDALLSRLHACRDAAGRLAVFERRLCARAAGRGCAVHPALAGIVLRPGGHGMRVGELVQASGLSHRHCIAVFRQATGLAPAEWLRLRRFSHALDLACDPSLGWAEIAAASGFADQAHLSNTFRDTAGLTPSAWRSRADPATPRHVPR